MPITKSAKKALKQSEKKKVINIRYKRKFRIPIKEFRKSIESGDTSKAQQLLPSIFKALDKAAKHGTIKKNTASRNKSRLSKKLNPEKPKSEPEPQQIKQTPPPTQ